VPDTYDTGLRLPMNTKYLSRNPISRWLIQRFFCTVVSMVSSINGPVNKILDVGCGEGILSRHLNHLWPNASITGLDIDPELLMVAKKLVPRMTCVAGNVYAMAWDDKTYDMVCCTEVLEHLESPEQALSEINRVGRAAYLFSVPDEPWWRMANMARGSYLKDLGNSPGHLNHWSVSSFTRLLSGVFEVVAVKRPFPWIIVLCKKK
jgi:trans-aconitate methyltransferase